MATKNVRGIEPAVVEPVAGPRERYRAQVRAEVQELAWVQVTQTGASGLSLKAIAKQMGITAPALYRYFASRDELLTELILSVYRELAELVEAAAGARDADRDKLIATATALRDWALANPQRYLLIYGTPVPGYAAPPSATELAQRIFAPLLASFPGTPDQVLRQSLTFWTRLHGVISLEVAGHFRGMPFDPSELYADEVTSTVAGLP